jgi:hypothetical protein
METVGNSCVYAECPSDVSRSGNFKADGAMPDADIASFIRPVNGNSGFALNVFWVGMDQVSVCSVLFRADD